MITKSHFYKIYKLINVSIVCVFLYVCDLDIHEREVKIFQEKKKHI